MFAESFLGHQLYNLESGENVACVCLLLTSDYHGSQLELIRASLGTLFFQRGFYFPFQRENGLISLGNFPKLTSQELKALGATQKSDSFWLVDFQPLKLIWVLVMKSSCIHFISK